MEEPVLMARRKEIYEKIILRLSVLRFFSQTRSLHLTIMAIFKFKFELKLKLHNREVNFSLRDI